MNLEGGTRELVLNSSRHVLLGDVHYESEDSATKQYKDIVDMMGNKQLLVEDENDSNSVSMKNYKTPGFNANVNEANKINYYEYNPILMDKKNATCNVLYKDYSPTYGNLNEFKLHQKAALNKF